MAMDIVQGLPFAILWLALGMAMFPQYCRGWPIPACLSVATAVGTGVVEWSGLPIIVLFSGVSLVAVQCTFSMPVRVVAWGGTLVCAVVLAAHEVPWINNVLVFDAVTVSPLAAPYTLHWNYDKALAGVVLYAVCVQPQRKIEWRRMFVATAVIAALTPLVVAMPALGTNFVAWDPKWPSILLLWVPSNLLVTCVAEEVFFRGLLQRYVAWALRRTALPAASLVALFVGASAFGLAHLGGGITYAVLAAVAGLGYGAVYHVTQRVEASIIVHFILNLAHLLLFTYPFLAAN